MTEWYYECEGEQRGPVTEERLCEMVAAQEVLPGNLVWTAGMDEWATAREMFDLPGVDTDSQPPPIDAVRVERRSDAPTQRAPIAVAEQQTNPLAIISLVCGCVGLLSMLAAIAAIVLGCVALTQIKEAPERYSGKRLAIAGLVLAGLGVAKTVLIFGVVMLSIPFMAH